MLITAFAVALAREPAIFENSEEFFCAFAILQAESDGKYILLNGIAFIFLYDPPIIIE